MRLTVAAAASLIFISTLSAAEYAAASITQPTDIPAESLGSALEALAHDRNLQLIYATDDVGGRQSEGAIGNLSTGEALKRLLKGTGLSYQFLDEKTVTVQPAVGSYRDSDAGKPMGYSGARNSAAVQELRLAQAGPAAPQNVSSTGNYAQSASVSSESSSQLEEVLVTAQKTGAAERLQNVPIPISVISAEHLLETNKVQLGDYFDQIPGLMVAQGTGAASAISIRGITTGQNTSPTVGFTLDDVPLGGSTDGAAFAQVPFINPADIAQVEVLRGPQGTLFGDNSMGGLIRYVTVEPSTDHVFGDVRVGGDSVVNGSHLGYSTSAAINVPLTDTLAIRISAFTRLDPGYITDVETGQRGANTTTATGARIAVKWTPSADFTLKLSALDERSHLQADPGVDVPTIGYPETLGLGDLQTYVARGAGYDYQEWKTANLTLNANVFGVKLTSVSGYTVNGLTATQDATFAVPVSPSLAAPLLYTNSLHKFSQEVRLTDTLGSHLEWLLGGFYTQEDNWNADIWSTVNRISGAMVSIPGSVYYSGGPGRFRESAAFGGVTWKVIDPFDIQFGARESYLSNPALDRGSYSGGTLEGLPPGPSVYNPPNGSVYDAKAFTYLVSPRFKLSPDAMVYARIASGFRPGDGTSNPPPHASCVYLQEPCQVNPDKITNYEFGVKADFLNKTLSVDSSVYYIDWKDLQVTLTRGSLDYTANGAGAKSQGVDLSLEWKPLEGLTLSTWGAWDEAVTTEPFKNATAGERLPYSPRFSANFSAKQDMLITADIYAFVEGKEIYMGNRIGQFTSIAAPRQYYPAYSQTDLNAGIKVHPWTFNVYVNNLTDRRGAIYGGIGGAAPFEFNYINPRTIGVNLDRTF